MSATYEPGTVASESICRWCRQPIVYGPHAHSGLESWRHVAHLDRHRALFGYAACGVMHSAEPAPRIVCLCGSTRFTEAFQQASLDRTLAGEIVLSIGVNTKSDSDLLAAGVRLDKAALDELHKRKIDLADYVYVLNVNGYIGESTRSEIEYAKSIGRPIVYLERAEAVGSE